MSRDFDDHVAQAFKPHHLSSDQKGVARGKRGGKGFFHLAKRLTPAPLMQTHFQRITVLDGANIKPQPAGAARITQFKISIGILLQTVPLIIAAQRVAPSGTKLKAGVKFAARYRAIRACLFDLRE